MSQSRFESDTVLIQVEVLMLSHHTYYHILVYYNCFSTSNIWGRNKVSILI